MFCWFPNCTIDRNNFGPLLLSMEHTVAGLLVYRAHELNFWNTSEIVQFSPAETCSRQNPAFSETQFPFPLHAEYTVASKGPIHAHEGKKYIHMLGNQVEKSQSLYKCNICGSLSQLQRVCICWGHLTRHIQSWRHEQQTCTVLYSKLLSQHNMFK